MPFQKKKKSFIKSSIKNKYRTKRNKLLIGGLPGKNKKKETNNPITILIENISNIRNQQRYRANFQINDTVLTIKNSISANLGIINTDQRITYLGNILNDEQTLAECGIIDGSTVNVENTYASGTITIWVSNFDTSQTFVFTATYNSTILAVKQGISELFNINPNHMRLHFMDDILTDEEMLHEIGLINRRSVIFVENMLKN